MIKVSYNINIYRKELLKLLEDDFTVIELGCHVGKTSELILKKIINGRLIALDKSPESNEHFIKLKEIYENVDFIKGDVRKHEVLKNVYSKIPNCDLLSIDLGGGYHPDTAFKVFHIWSSVFKPKHSIIRNKGLIDFINSTSSKEGFLSSNGFLSSVEDEGIPPQIKEFSLWSNKL